jgi:hypothetical protein
VFFDSNSDALQDVGDTAAGNVDVRLTTRDGTLLATERTNATGYYLFNSLRHSIPRLTPLAVVVELPSNNAVLNGELVCCAKPTTTL